MSAKALQTVGKGDDLKVVSVDPPAPDAGYVSIRVKVVSLNPVDWKRWLFNVFGEKHPIIQGSESTGIIEAVGSGVKDFKAGDEVIAFTNTAKAGGSFQEIVVVPAGKVVRKPKNATLEESTGLVAAFMTAASAIYAYPSGFGVPLPFLPNGDQTVHTPFKSILVLGGSSTVGASAIQLLRLALPDAVILTTSSPKHHVRLTQELGADKAFDQNSSSLIEDVKAATPGGQGVDVILDSVYALSTNQTALQALDAKGPKVAVVVTGGAPFTLPEDIKKVDSSSDFVLDRPGVQGLLDTLPVLYEAGQFKLPYKVEVAGTGLESIQAALLQLKNGVSGTKLVVKLSEREPVQ